jgi:hypothetical protein
MYQRRVSRLNRIGGGQDLLDLIGQNIFGSNWEDVQHYGEVAEAVYDDVNDLYTQQQHATDIIPPAGGAEGGLHQQGGAGGGGQTTTAPSSNTMLYVGLGALALLLLMKK